MVTLVQNYLLNHSLNDLERDHGIKHRIKEHKISLNYDQLETKENDPLGKECRGLILTPVVYDNPVNPDLFLGETKIMARPFDRFFNHGQSEADKIDFNHSRFYEKMDGTLTILYHDFVKDEWHIATRAVAEADLPIDGFGEYTFRTLFEKACFDTINLTFDKFVENLDKNLTYIFELTTPINRIVVDYKDYKITILGIRNNVTGEEYDPLEWSNEFNVPLPQIYSFNSLQEMVEFVSSFDPQKHEGIVACDTCFNRVKVKNPSYVALNRIKDSVTKSPRGLLELILLEKFDDVISLFPEYISNKGIELQQKLRHLNQTYNTVYNDCINVISKKYNQQESKEYRKAFALYMQDANVWLSPMMDRYSGNSGSFVEWIRNKKQFDGGWSNGFLDQVINNLQK